jgi:branched-chain amino acid transport system ATP-binding protein
MTALLRLQDVRVMIRGFVILRGVSLEVASGAAVGLVGRNGAGKTTTLRSIMGLVPVSGGSAAFDGRDLRATPAHWRARLGIGYLPEDRRLVGPLTVRENLLLPAWATGMEHPERRLDAILTEMPEVRELAARQASLLSGGQQKMVGLARALMAGSRLVLLDEPFEGLAPGLAQRLATVVGAFQGHGVAVLVAESDLNRARYVADTIYTVERGEVAG